MSGLLSRVSHNRYRLAWVGRIGLTSGKRNVILLMCALALSSMAGAQNFPDVSERHRGYFRFLVLMNQGFGRNSKDRRLLRAPTPPAEMAAMLIDWVADLPKTWRRLLDEAQASEHQDREIIRVAGGNWEADFAIAIDACSPWIKKLGRDPGQLLRTVHESASLAQQVVTVAKAKPHELGREPLFDDVSPKHWAWKRVYELRDAGILRGYPGNRFGGRQDRTLLGGVLPMNAKLP